MFSVSSFSQSILFEFFMYLKISIYFLNLYNFNDLEYYDEIFLGVGIFFALLWLGTGVGMVRYISILFLFEFLF
jgi:hypothetical protein